jgi:hypothetical protein
MKLLGTLFGHARGLPGLTLAAAFLLFLTPLFGATYGVSVASAMILGGAALLLWAKLALAPDEIDFWLMAVLGMLILLAPLFLGFGAFSSWAFLMHLIAGIAIAGVAGYDIVRRRKAEEPKSDTDTGSGGDETQGAGQTT